MRADPPPVNSVEMIFNVPSRRATLVIARIDRLSRDAHFLLGLQKAGVKFVAVDMPEANEMVVGIMAVIAEGERKMISKRTRDALAAAKARGTALGGFKGYCLGEADRQAASAALKAKVKALAADLAPIIAELRARGVTSLNGIAQALTSQQIPTARGSSTWTPTGVRRLLDLID
jgi:DNA invertase Pin-like site-specific DNA recombinase